MFMERKEKDITELVQAFDEIQMSRTPYILENMVVNSKFTQEQRYAQCVLELSIAYDNLRLANLHIEQKQIEIDEIKTEGRKGEIEKEIKRIELEQTRRAVLGTMREFDSLYEIWLKFPKRYTREELNNAQEKEYAIRLELQAQQDLNATGRITQGNQEGLRQIGKMIYPELDIARSVENLQVLEEVSEMLSLIEGKKLILEIGTSMGGTLCHMMKVASDDAEFVSVDLPGGLFGGEFGQPNIEVMKSWLKGNQKLHTIRADSKSFLTVEQVRKILNGRKFDFILIDGDHTYEGVKGDYEIYKQFAGDIIAFHDIVEHQQKDVGVKKLWEEIQGNKIEIIKDVKQGWGGIGILMV